VDIDMESSLYREYLLVKSGKVRKAQLDESVRRGGTKLGLVIDILPAASGEDSHGLRCFCGASVGSSHSRLTSAGGLRRGFTFGLARP
jgi:hypothetical protein